MTCEACIGAARMCVKHVNEAPGPMARCSPYADLSVVCPLSRLHMLLVCAVAGVFAVCVGVRGEVRVCQ